MQPGDATLVARDAAAEVSDRLIPPNATRALTKYDESLTPKQRELLFAKVLTTFEDEALSMTDKGARSNLRPKQEDWSKARMVIQHHSSRSALRQT